MPQTIWHLFLDKDSHSPIENFSRLQHLVSERSERTTCISHTTYHLHYSKNLNLELMLISLFAQNLFLPTLIRHCLMFDSINRTHVLLLLLLFFLFFTLATDRRHLSFVIRPAQNLDIGYCVRLNSSVVCGKFVRQYARSRQSIGPINAFFDCGHSILSNKFSIEFIVCDPITNCNDNQLVYGELKLKKKKK